MKTVPNYTVVLRGKCDKCKQDGKLSVGDNGKLLCIICITAQWATVKP